MKIIFTTLFILIISGTNANASSYKNLNGNLKLSDEQMLNEKIMTEAKDLEAVLISTMVNPMFPKGEESDLYGGGHGSDIYRMMMIQEYGKIMSNDGGLGIAKGIAKDLTKK